MEKTSRKMNSANAFIAAALLLPALTVLSVSGGKVGIGTATPGANSTDPLLKLDVQGNVNVSGNIHAEYEDVAEWVPSEQKLEAGTLVVLDAERDNHVPASTTAYDTKVAGVVSARPGISLGEGGEGKALVATTGRVKVKVNAARAHPRRRPPGDERGRGHGDEERARGSKAYRYQQGYAWIVLHEIIHLAGSKAVETTSYRTGNIV